VLVDNGRRRDFYQQNYTFSLIVLLINTQRARNMYYYTTQQNPSIQYMGLRNPMGSIACGHVPILRIQTLVSPRGTPAFQIHRDPRRWKLRKTQNCSQEHQCKRQGLFPWRLVQVGSIASFILGSKYQISTLPTYFLLSCRSDTQQSHPWINFHI